MTSFAYPGAAAVAAGALATLVVSAQTPERRADGTREVLALLRAQEAAWNAVRLEAFMDGYWRSADLTFFSGNERTRGWQETLDRYRRRYRAGGQEMGALSFRDQEVEMLGPEAALARGRWELTRQGRATGGLFTLILKRLPEGWRIVHDHTSW